MRAEPNTQPPRDINSQSSSFQDTDNELYNEEFAKVTNPIASPSPTVDPISSMAPSSVVEELVVETPSPLKTVSRKWLEDRVAELRFAIENDDINIESFIEKLATLASFTFCITSQIETDERNKLYKQLNELLKEQQKLYNSNAVFYADVIIATFTIATGVIGFAGASGMASPGLPEIRAKAATAFRGPIDARPATQDGFLLRWLPAGISSFLHRHGEKILGASNPISQGMQSVTKIMGNRVESNKVKVQHHIERIKQMIEISRNRSATHDRQASETDSRINQARQQLQSLVDKLTQ